MKNITERVIEDTVTLKNKISIFKQKLRPIKKQAFIPNDELFKKKDYPFYERFRNKSLEIENKGKNFLTGQPQSTTSHIKIILNSKESGKTTPDFPSLHNSDRKIVSLTS